MASDSRVHFEHNNTWFPSQKIHVVRGALVGCAGRSIDCAQFIEWYAKGANPKKRPELGDEDNALIALVLSHAGLFLYEEDCTPSRIDRDFHAIGTGALAALVAMDGGKAPKRAIELACKYDPNCGGPVQVLTLP